MEDIRYSEFLFLRGVATGEHKYFNYGDGPRSVSLGLESLDIYSEMVMASLEDLHVRVENTNANSLVLRLRGELPDKCDQAVSFPPWQWANPREGLKQYLRSNTVSQLAITYRGLQRIEELRDLLRRDQILEPFGVLLDLRYFRRELEDSLKRSSETAVSVLYTDMDNFKRINDEFGHQAGDVVMKAYLESVRSGLEPFGTGFRGRGDETVALIIGQGHERAVKIAEGIRTRVEAMRCEHKGTKLPPVTTSIGVATTPPASRSPEVEALADERQSRAKKSGRNRVVFE